MSNTTSRLFLADFPYQDTDKIIRSVKVYILVSAFLDWNETTWKRASGEKNAGGKPDLYDQGTCPCTVNARDGILASR